MSVPTPRPSPEWSRRFEVAVSFDRTISTVTLLHKTTRKPYLAIQAAGNLLLPTHPPTRCTWTAVTVREHDVLPSPTLWFTTEHDARQWADLSNNEWQVTQHKPRSPNQMCQAPLTAAGTSIPVPTERAYLADLDSMFLLAFHWALTHERVVP